MSITKEKSSINLVEADCNMFYVSLMIDHKLLFQIVALSYQKLQEGSIHHYSSGTYCSHRKLWLALKN